MPSAKSDARWRDGILLTFALWFFVLLTALPYIITRYPAGEWFSVVLDVSTIFVSIAIGLLVFACFRLSVGWPTTMRAIFLGSVVLAAAVLQASFDLIYTGWVAQNLSGSFGSLPQDLKEGYQKWFRYLLVYAGNVALFQLAFVNRRSLSSERQLTDARAAAQHAQLEALRYQLNPHFLFNTLNSISSLIVTRRNEDAEHMTNKLSSFLRSSLTCDPAGLIPLDEELALIEEYLDIEAVRFGERLNVEIECEPAAGSALIPGFLVQPLVENAIKHGVAPSRDTVTIRLKATLSDGLLCITVENDKAPEEDRITVGSTGVGLSNVRRRLRAVFGESASLAAERTGDGFIATICIPSVKASA
jgi:signal transduction histidine kinase